MSSSRRNFFQDAMFFGAGLLGLSARLDAQSSEVAPAKRRPYAPAASDAPPGPMIAPDVSDLPFELDRGTKVFRLKASPLKLKIAPF